MLGPRQTIPNLAQPVNQPGRVLDDASDPQTGVSAAQSNPKLEAMYKAYEAKKYPEAHSPYTKYAYDATGILLEAIKTASVKDKAGIAKAIRNIRYDGANGMTTFDANGQTQIPVDIEVRTVSNGQWGPYTK